MASSIEMAQDLVRCNLCSNSVELFCNPCFTNLCSSCVTKHMSSQKGVTHEIVLFKSRNDIALPFCKKHSKQKCEAFCKQCCAPVCTKCLLSSHKMHDAVDFLEECNSKRKSIQEETKELESSVIVRCDKKKTNLKAVISKIQKGYEKINSHILEQGHASHDKIDEITKRERSKSQTHEEHDLSALKEQISYIENHKAKIRKFIIQNKELLKRNDALELVNYTSQQGLFSGIYDEEFRPSISFSTKHISNEEICRRLENAFISSEKGSMEYELLTAFYSGDVKLNRIQCSDANEVWLSFLSDRTIFKSFDIDGVLMNTIRVKGRIGDMRLSSKGTLMYINPSLCKVYEVKSSGESEIISLQGWTPMGIACTRSNEILICIMNFDSWNLQTRIVRFSSNNYKTPRQIIQHDADNKPLYGTGHWYIFMEENYNKDVCASDGNSKAIIAVDRDGKFRYRYTGNLSSQRYPTFSPEYLVADKECRILVADEINNCIHMIDGNGKFLRYIDKFALRSPRGMSLDSKGRLWVGEVETGIVKVIKYTD